MLPSNWPSINIRVMNASCKVQWIRPPLRGALSINSILLFFISRNKYLISLLIISHLHLALLLVSSGDSGGGKDWRDTDDDAGGVSSLPETGSFSVDPKAVGCCCCGSSAAEVVDILSTKKKRFLKMDRDEQSKKPATADDESGIRRNIATQMETSHEGLLSNDRRMLKAYLGYIPVVQLHDGIKRINNACAYVQSTLWPDKLTPQQKELEEKPYDLAEEYVKEKIGQEIPRIFPKETLEDARKMFMEACKDITTPEAESGLLRAFQVK